MVMVIFIIPYNKNDIYNDKYIWQNLWIIIALEHVQYQYYTKQ